jgi:CIC family chloride channel protein
MGEQQTDWLKRAADRLKGLFRPFLNMFFDRPIEENLREFWAERHVVVWLAALAAGIIAAYGTIAFRFAIAGVQFLWIGSGREAITSLLYETPWWQVMAGPVAAGLLVGLVIDFWLPGKRPRGVAQVIEAAHLNSGRMPFREGMVSAGLAAISLGAGASAGREGPAVHLGATLTSKIATYLKLPPDMSRVLLASGVAAAVSASFNAPLAGVLFAHEVILAHYALRAFVPTTIASVVGTAIVRFHIGDQPAFSLPDYVIMSYWEFPAFALLGVVCAVVAISFMMSSFVADHIVGKIRIPLWMKPAIGGLLIGAIGLLFPEVLGVGYEATDNALKQNYGLWLLIALVAAKIVATAITLAARFGGGVFSPSLYLGAMAGGAFGIVAASISPGLASEHGVYAIVGMGAVAAAVLGAPLSSTIMVFELIGTYEVAVALLLANSISTALTQAVIGKSFFHWQLEQRHLHLHEGPHRRVLLSLHVRDLMTWYDTPRPQSDLEEDSESPKPPRLVPGDNLGKALGLMENRELSTYPVSHPDDSGMIVGEITEKRALRAFNDALIMATREEHH